MAYPTKGARNRLLKAGAIAAMLLALAVPPCFSESSQAGDDALVIGVFPRRPAIETRQMFQPLTDYLAKMLDRPVRLEVPPDFPAFWQAVSDDRFDLVHYSPFHYVRAHQELGHHALLMNEEYSQNRIRAALWVRKDSGIRSAEDLRGQKVIFGGGHMAMVSYVMATDLLRQAGLADTDYLQQFAINPTSALQAVYYRQGVAAGLNRQADKQAPLQRKVDFRELQPLLISQAVAHHPWSVTPKASPALASRIRQALLALKDESHGQEILASAGLTGFSPASDADYDPHRQIIRRVTGKDYREH